MSRTGPDDPEDHLPAGGPVEPDDDWPRIDRQRLTPEEKRARIDAALAGRPWRAPMRVFGFGSLMWNPGFEWTARFPGVVKGYHRCFRIYSTRARGTPDRPGLGLCMERDEDAECRGIVFELAEATLQQDMQTLWDREQNSGVYDPVWLPVEAEAGTFQALTFVVRCDHPHYCGHLPPERMARIMAKAEGVYGRNRDYVANLIEEMAGLGLRDPELERLLALIDAEA